MKGGSIRVPWSMTRVVEGMLGACAALALACASEVPAPPQPVAAESSAALPAPALRPIESVTTDRGTLALLRDESGNGLLRHTTPDGLTRDVDCELEGAWGLWVNDVDGDGRREVLVALRKRARHDPRVENRLHVHSLEGGRCVPVWRGTRLAGRFDDLAVDPDEPGVLLALERAGASRRIGQYRWSDFGYSLEAELWRGDGTPPAPLASRFVHVSLARDEGSP